MLEKGQGLNIDNMSLISFVLLFLLLLSVLLGLRKEGIISSELKEVIICLGAN